MDNTVLIPVPCKILKKNGLRLISLWYLLVNNKLYNCSNLFNTEIFITLTTLFDFSFQHYPHKIDENRKKEYLFLFVCLSVLKRMSLHAPNLWFTSVRTFRYGRKFIYILLKCWFLIRFTDFDTDLCQGWFNRTSILSEMPELQVPLTSCGLIDWFRSITAFLFETELFLPWPDSRI